MVGERIIKLEGGPPWGFRFHGGHDLKCPIRITRINPNSKASERDIKEGDYVTKINDQSLKQLKNNEIHSLIKNTGDSLTLHLTKFDDSPTRYPRRLYFKEYKPGSNQKSQEINPTSNPKISIQAANPDATADPSNILSDEDQQNEDEDESSLMSCFPIKHRKERSGDSTKIVKSTATTTATTTTTSKLENEVTEQRQVENQKVTLFVKTVKLENNNSGSENSIVQGEIDNNNNTDGIVVDNSNCISPDLSGDKKNIIIKNILISDVQQQNYRVDSPVELVVLSSCTSDRGGKLSAQHKKSRSLDDNEITIQELSANSSTTSMGNDTTNPPIICEVSSDSEASRSDGVFSPPISEEEEHNLRGFLRTLNIDENGNEIEETTPPQTPNEGKPSDSGIQIIHVTQQQTNQGNDIKARRARKRAEIESHFLPLIANPRYLDIIKEESSDTSDIDRKSDKTENDYDLEYDLDDDVFIDKLKIVQKTSAVYPKSTLIQRHVVRKPHTPTDVIREEPQLMIVDTKLLEPINLVEESCTTNWRNEIVDAPIEASVEMIYVDSNSDTTSNSDVMDLDYTGDVDDELTSDTEVRIETPVIGGEPATTQEYKVRNDNSDIDSFSRETTPDANHYSNQNHNNANANITNSSSSSSQLLNRQDSVDSVCSSNNSQSTTRYVETSQYSELDSISDFDQMKTLRELCVEHLATKPYGGAVLEELATVSESIGSLTSDKEKKLRGEMMTPPPPPIPPMRNLKEKSPSPPPVPSPPPPPVPERPTEFFSNFTMHTINSSNSGPNRNTANNQMENHANISDHTDCNQTTTTTNTATAATNTTANVLPQVYTTTAQVNLRTTEDDHHAMKKPESIEKIENLSLISPSSELNTKNSSTTTTTRTATSAEAASQMYDLISESPPLPQIPMSKETTTTITTTLDRNTIDDELINAANAKNRLLAIIRQSSSDNNNSKPVGISNTSDNKCESSVKSVQSTSFESKKIIENGNLVYESSDKNRKVLKNVDGQIIENVNETESSENKSVKPASAFSGVNNIRSATSGVGVGGDKLPKNKLNENENEFIFKEFDFVPNRQHKPNGIGSDSGGGDASASSGVRDDKFKSKSHHDFFFNKHFDELNAEFKRKFESNLMRSAVTPTRPISMQDQMRLNSESFDDWMKHARQQASTTTTTKSSSATTNQSTENVMKPIMREDNFVRNGRSVSNVDIRAPRISTTQNESQSNREREEVVQRQYSMGQNRNLHTRQSMIDETPITQTLASSTLPKRRMSLPKELHERQLNAIRQKENELKAEFERLEAERRKLEMEMFEWNENLDENMSFENTAEEFRKKMQNEWLNKVAEREERRMQKIVKISKPHDEVNVTSTSGRNDLGNEFLSRVKERRSKLNMPSDSDWESGAESQPSESTVNKTEKSSREHIIKVNLVEGEQIVDDRKKIPKHLQEFLDLTSESIEKQEQSVADGNSLQPPLLKAPPPSAASASSSSNEKIIKIEIEDQQQSNVRSTNNTTTSTSTTTTETGPATAASDDGIWSPNSRSVDNLKFQDPNQSGKENSAPEPPPPPVWTPGPSPTFQRKEFRPVNFESPTFQRKLYTRQESGDPPIEPPWDSRFNPHTQNIHTSAAAASGAPKLQSSLSTGNINNFGLPSVTSQSSTSSTQWSTRNVNLPKFQNPTVTLLQRAREEQQQQKQQQQQQQQQQQHQQQQQQQRQQQAQNIQNQYYQDYSRNYQTQQSVPAFMQRDKPNEIIHTVRRNYVSESELIDNDQRSTKMTTKSAAIENNTNNNNDSPIDRHLSKETKFIEGIGPTTTDGMPIVLRSEVNENNQSKWYKKMYNTLHKAKDDDDYVTVRYKTRRGRYPYKTSGYMSEPEPNYDSDYSIKYSTLDRRRTPVANGSHSYYEKSYGTLPNPIKTGAGIYKNQPGRIENYVPGHSSISEKETKQWWDEVMEIFDGWLDENSSLPYFSIVFAREVQKFHLEQQKHVPNQFTQGNLSRALKHEGYESDSSLVFKREQTHNFAPLSPVEQKQMYRSMQSGGEPPLQGFRKLAPEKPKDEFDEIEYYPITSTLTKIRVNKKSNMHLNNQNEIICYPITNITKPIDLFGSYSKTAHSFVPVTPPPPPNRRSSKRNTILQMFSETRIKSSSNQPAVNTAKRHHEACYQSTETPGSTSIMKRSNTSESIRSKSSGPILSATATRRTASLKEEKNLENNTTRHIARRQYLRVSSASPVNRSRLALDRKSSPSPVAFGRGISKERTFAEEKKRLEQARQDLVAPTRILRNPALKSPDEVKRALQSTFKLPARSDRNVCIRASRQSLMATSANRKSGETTIRVQMSQSVPASITRSSRLSKTTKNGASNSSLSLARTNSTYSIDSTQSKPKKSTKTTQSMPRSPVTISGKSKSRKKITASKEKLEINKRGTLRRGKHENESVVAENTTSSVQKRDQYDNKEVVQTLNEAIIQHKDRGDNFFQNLFLRNLPSPTPSTSSSYYKNTSVMEKARMWNSLSHELKPQQQPQQTIYLSTKKPVSRSKFKLMEEERLIVPRMSRSLSPTKHLSKYDSIYHFSSENEDEFELNEDEFGNGNVTKSLTYSYHERSRSEPQTKSTTIMTEIRRPNSPIFIHGRSNSSSIEYRSISPVRSHVRSPSCRRIHSFRSNNQSASELVQQRKVSRARSVGSADSSYHMSSTSNLMRSSCSLSNLNYEKHNPLSCYHHNHPHSHHHSHRKSERFRELNEFYSNLERVGQLERATSTSDIRPIRSEEEVIDFDLWKKIREHQKAEKELTYLVQKLKEKQKDKDFLFKPHDVDEIKWDRERDSGLRIKEKSVEDLREVFHRKADDSLEIDEDFKQKLDTEKGTYKLLYRGSSVLDLASNMVEKYNGPRRTEKIKSSKPYKFPLSNKLISTLSKDQISKIKHQLSEIYSNGPHSSNSNKQSEKYEEISEKYIITVPPPVPPSCEKYERPTGLTVRSNSLMTREELLSPKLQRRRELMEKSESISSINHKPQVKSSFAASSTSATATTTTSNTVQLSESEKRKLSLNLCREIKDKISQRRQEKIELLPKETRGAYAAEMSIPKPPPSNRIRSHSEDNYTSTLVKVEPATYTSTVNRRTKTKTSHPPRPISFCGTDTLNSLELAQKYGDDVRSKIKYFEEKKTDEDKKGTTIYHAREDSSPDEEEIIKLIEQKFKFKNESDKPLVDISETAEKHGQSASLGSHPLQPSMQSSSSVTDLQEMFGEKKTQPSRPISNSSSCESLVYHQRSRSASPKLSSLPHERSYINVIRAGDVRKIKDKFESLDGNIVNADYWSTDSKIECGEQLPKLTRRFRSDPELDQFDFFDQRDTSAKQTNKTTIRDHEAGDVSRITHKFEIRNSINQNRSLNRSRKRTREIRVTSPIPKIPLKKDDRFMPHIDIISKTASLKQEIKKPNVSSSWPTRAAGSNEIEKIKTKFENQEKLSILGQMYTSTPDFRELKDISSYLSGSWVAHKFPKPQDNAITTTVESNKSTELVAHKRPSSTSPPRRTTPSSKALITSILKPYYDIFADQKYDPLMHRPKYRYVPGKEAEAETLWRKLQNNINKLSVKFEGESEVVVPPPPPLKGIPLHSYQTNQHEQESPRRYIEGDVNIHYRTPIRQEFKDVIPEDELMHRQAEAMRRLYQEEKKRKYLQELQDINNRRHMDNFTPSQKSPIALNRYDSFPADLSPQSPKSTQQYTMVAKALYNFQGQSARELNFKKGDIIYIRRQIDKNWYEGEHNAMFGLFPANYVEIITRDNPRPVSTLPRKPSEGQARAKYNFKAQSAIELSLNRGEIVTLTRRVDDNWFEGRIANRKGIFPVSYVDVLMEIGTHDHPSKPVGAPAAHSLITSATTPPGNVGSERLAGFMTNGNTLNGDEIVQRETKTKQNTEVLHVDTTSEPITYRALYKYRPQNSDELELNEGDLIYVLEKCDDGWFVGTSQRTGYFGTFPGNYVDKL